MIEIVEISKKATDYNSYEVKKVYEPAILKRMCLSRYLWWGDTENDKKRIIKYLEFVSLEKAEKQIDF